MGKTTQVVLALVAIWGVIIWRFSDSLVLDAMLMVAGVIATGCVCWWITSAQRFAAANPAQAMLEGAELIEYQRFEAEAKGGARLSGPMGTEESAPRLTEGEP
jgi:hypothetical protein